MKPLRAMIVLMAVLGVVVPQHAGDVGGETKGSGQLERLFKDLKDQSWQVRWYAVTALGDLRDPRAVEPLIAALKDDNAYVRMTAAWALGEIGDSRAVESLIAALSDENHDVIRGALQSLQKITGKDFGEDPAPWQKWWEKNR